MANQFRFRSGQIELHKAAVDSDTVIAVGDLVYLDDDEVKPASDFPFTTNLATTQGNFAAVFLGVAHESSAEGETDPISVDLSPFSVYEFDVDAATFVLGDTIGPDGTASALEAQRMQKVATAAQAIARAAESKASSSTRLRVQFASAFHPASANVNAAIG